MINKIQPPSGLIERFQAGFLRIFLRTAFKTMIGPRSSVATQRIWVQLLALLMPGKIGLRRHRQNLSGLDIQIISPRQNVGKSVILFLHGGAFCLGNNFTHRSLCSHLAFESRLPVWIPNYRLAPEHPYPCALDDAVDVYRELLRHYPAQQIVIAGDSAGASLALALALRLKQRALQQPACMLLISPVTDGQALRREQLMGGRGDPMISAGWLGQGVSWLNAPEQSEFAPLLHDLSGLPPMLIQVGEEEILLNDSLQLEQLATQAGVECRLEYYLERWHVFHLQSFYLKSSKLAIGAMARFAQAHLSS
ncbi:acetyl esterase/lipase [Oxalobacteraceae bacterium GrIS 2.11]